MFRAQVLKSAISSCSKSQDGGDTTLFKQLLQAELRKVSAFYSTQWCVPLFRGSLSRPRRTRHARHARLTGRPGRSDALAVELDALERAVRPPGGGGEAGGAPTPASLAAAQRALVAVVVPLLGRLRLFVVLNYTACVKARSARPGTAPAAPLLRFCALRRRR